MTIFVATGEIALRAIYRDAGKRTLGGPGGRSFEHMTVRDDQRGRLDVGAKNPAKPRIMIVGDSITWGQGVREWQDTWPERLARALESAGTPHEMAVIAMPGRDIPGHVQEVEQWIGKVDPDVFIYQWYVNDIEVEPRRPRNARSWQTWAGHETLRASSYLYYFLDNRLATYLPAPERSYVDYILQDYAPGSLEWSEFERYFHTLAMRAQEHATTRVLVVYPQVPFGDRSPLQPIYDRVTALAAPHRLSIPPAAWIRYGGEPAAHDGGAAFAFPATPGPAFDTRDYYFAAGALHVAVRVSIGANASISASVGTVDLLDAATNAVLSSAPLAAAAGGWHDAVIALTLPEPARRVRFRVNSNGVAPFSVGEVAVAVDYAFSVVDLGPALNSFNTHTSIFDAHPNERAHQVVAEKVLEGLQKAAPKR